MRLSAILKHIAAYADAAADGLPPGRTPSGVRIGDIIDLTPRAGFGVVIGLLALIAIPFVGVSLFFGVSIAFLGLQMGIGCRRPWLPARVRRHMISSARSANPIRRMQ